MYRNKPSVMRSTRITNPIWRNSLIRLEYLATGIRKKSPVVTPAAPRALKSSTMRWRWFGDLLVGPDETVLDPDLVWWETVLVCPMFHRRGSSFPALPRRSCLLLNHQTVTVSLSVSGDHVFPDDPLDLFFGHSYGPANF